MTRQEMKSPIPQTSIGLRFLTSFTRCRRGTARKVTQKSGLP